MIDSIESYVGLKVNARFCFCLFLREQLDLVIMSYVLLVCDVGWLEQCIHFSFLENFRFELVKDDEDHTVFKLLLCPEISHDHVWFVDQLMLHNDVASWPCQIVDAGYVFVHVDG